MKKLLLFCFGVSLTLAVSAQKVYFVYLQTEDLSPFYVRISDKIYSSAVSGFLILPNLTDSTYNLNIGFAKSSRPETKFAVTVHQNDKGYLVKNFDDGLGLFDMQALSVLKPASSFTDNTVYETKTDKFSSVLSKAADDPGLLKVPVKKEEITVQATQEKTVDKPNEGSKVEVNESSGGALIVPVGIAGSNNEKKEEPARDKKDDLVTVDSAAATQVTEKQEEVKELTADVNTKAGEMANYKPSVISRHSESSTTEGFGIVYHDTYEGGIDTIRILIPPAKYKISSPDDTAGNNNNGLSEGDTSNLLVFPTAKTETNVSADSEATLKEQGNSETTKDVTGYPSTTAIPLPANCKSVASDKDFMKLRKSMAARESDEEMITDAKKVFKAKCFTTEQVRYLSALFLTSAGKYQFFDAAYEHVTDKKAYTSLQSEIRDEYYLKRFKALIGE